MRIRFLSVVLASFLPGNAIGQTAQKESGTESPEFIAARVNGEPITIGEIDAILKADLPGAPLSPAQHRSLRRALLDDLVDEKLLRQFLAKHAPKVDQAELDAQMTAFKAALIRENRSLDEFLRRSHQTEAQLREGWAARIQLTNYVKQLATDEKLKAYHAANRDHFDRVEVRVSHVLIRAGRDAPAVERASAKEKLQQIRTKIIAGELAFPLAARKYSQCPTAFKSGDMGFLLRRGLPEDEPLAKTAFALKVGELSDVVESDRGFHLLMVTERKPGNPSVLEKCVVEVLEALIEDTRAELVKKLRRESSVRILLP
jgi:peptidyl-prolyl cis-trans isomerase C